MIEAAADAYLGKIDPLLNIVKARPVRVVGSSNISPAKRNFVLRRDSGECQFPTLDGGICKSRHQVQVDHILAVALGGTNEVENLRVLCREHNFQAAEKVFRKKHMSTYLRT